jgi:hypothetical protein
MTNIANCFERTLFKQESRNVVGVVVVNSEGFPIMSSLDSTLTVQVDRTRGGNQYGQGRHISCSWHKHKYGLQTKMF